MPVSVSYRVLLQDRVCVVRLKLCRGIAAWATDGEPRGVLRLCWSVLMPSSGTRCCLLACCGGTGGGAFYEPSQTETVMSKTSRSSGIEKRSVSCPPSHNELHLCATSWTCGDKRCWVGDVSRLKKGVVLQCDYQLNGISFDGTACMHKAEVSDFHETVRQDVLQEAADKLNHVEVGGPLPSASRFAVGEGDGAVLE